MKCWYWCWCLCYVWHCVDVTEAIYVEQSGQGIGPGCTQCKKTAGTQQAVQRRTSDTTRRAENNNITLGRSAYPIYDVTYARGALKEDHRRTNSTPGADKHPQMTRVLHQRLLFRHKSKTRPPDVIDKHGRRENAVVHYAAGQVPSHSQVEDDLEIGVEWCAEGRKTVEIARPLRPQAEKLLVHVPDW